MNIDQNSENLFHFHYDDYPVDVSHIMALYEADFHNRKCGTFFIHRSVEWDQAILGAFIQVLYYFKERGILWEEFDMTMSYSDQPFTSPLLHTVNSLNIFKKMKVQVYFGRGDNEYDVDCDYLFPGISNNKCLESLDVAIESDALEIDQEICLPLISFLQETTTLKDLQLGGPINMQSFCEALAENESLEKLGIAFWFTDIADEGISSFITFVEEQQNIRELYINTSDKFGDLSSQALEQLLSNSSTLTALSLENFTTMLITRRCNAECIVQGLINNQSLKSLKLMKNSLYGDLILSRIFGVLSDCPKLERLELTRKGWENVYTNNDLEQVIHMDRLQKPIILFMPVYEQYHQAIETLLQRHPEVRLTVYPMLGLGMPRYIDDFMWDIEDLFGDNINLKHIYELNWHGRYLLDRRGVPLSLWPLVFERVKKKPNIIYEFLKGPAFAGRYN